MKRGVLLRLAIIDDDAVGFADPTANPAVGGPDVAGRRKALAVADC